MDNINQVKRQSLVSLGKIIAVINFYPICEIVSAATSTTPSTKENIITIAVRLWSAADYSRLTFESTNKIDYHYLVSKNAEEILIEFGKSPINLSGLTVVAELIKADPYIKDIHFSEKKIGQNQRLIIALKQKSNPQIFANPPIASYKHRLFIDVYPQTPTDPIQTLIELNENLDKMEAENKTINRAEAVGKNDDELAKMLAKLNKSTEIQIGKSRNTPELKLDNLLDEINNNKTSLDNNKAKPSTTPKQVGKTVNAPAVIKSKSRLIVVLDPGHGGEDPGAVGARGTYEKNVVLLISQYAKIELEKFGFATVLTRDRDFFIPLGQRVKKARDLKADLFISVHADAFTRREADGSSIYILSEKGASSSAAKWLAQKENSADVVGGISLSKNREVSGTLQDLVRSRGQAYSNSLAQNVLNELAKINQLHKKEIERAGFAVLKAAEIPSVLIETAFISNPSEERRLNNKDYQKALAAAIARGVFRFSVDMV